MNVEINNINTKSYWEHRFVSNWKKNGSNQTIQYAKANMEFVNLPRNFNGTILDFGCALGDAIPIYLKAFPNAKITGQDISETAIAICKSKYGKIAKFRAGDVSTVSFTDVIFASHVMEHITDDISVVKRLLEKCSELFIFVPFKEMPLYIEHVNYYDTDYFDELNVLDKKIYTVKYKSKLPIKSVIKNFLNLRFITEINFSKEIIMFHLKGIKL
jgi:trans-aconitate methyltransferase